MGYRVDNAVIMAAGLSSRFAPISYEKPKPLIEVRGEILIERQIRQLLETGISEIILVTGYKQEQFQYLKEKFDVIIVENKEYITRNNHSSIYAAKEYLKNTYICSADNYFSINPFETEVEESYYATLYASEQTEEWCLQIDENDYITDIKIGGSNQWYMFGHVFWSEDFSCKFTRILDQIYWKTETKNKLWEDIYHEYIQQFRMKIRRYDEQQIYEFDSLDELRLFDHKYVENSGSAVMEKISAAFHCSEGDITNLLPVKNCNNNVVGVSFSYNGNKFQYLYRNRKIISKLGEKNEGYEGTEGSKKTD